MTQELERSMRELATQGPQTPYYLAYAVRERDEAEVAASLGALTRSTSSRHRALEVDLRVGDKHLDNTHQTRTDEFVSSLFSFHDSQPFPVDDDVAAARQALWIDTDRRYKDAVRRLDAVRAHRAVKAAEEEVSDDFSDEPAQRYIEAPQRLSMDRVAWEERIRRWSGFFRSYPDIYHSEVALQAARQTHYFTSSDRASLVHGALQVRLFVWVQTRAEDGEDLRRFESFDAASFDRLPDEAAVKATLVRVADEVLALRRAPPIDPFTGPAILEGRAAGVFFHETLGHRLEGHRQKRDIEGQTFAKKRGERVMSDLIDVFDDPRAAATDHEDLNGHYLFDDEGVPAQRADLVQAGVLQTFLMSRSPTHGVARSNGHGRRASGFPLVARQANLVVAPRSTVTATELRRQLIEQAKRQGNPFGLLFRELEGGFTQTRRLGIQAFQVVPVMVFRVYADGRPDELVRGANIVGTPLAALNEIVGAAGDYATFNGVCGAESGAVPVSATAPSLLVRRIEVARKFKDDERPPVLPPPPPAPAAAGT